MRYPDGVIGVKPHEMAKKILHWARCARCGLISLRNEATRKRLREGCYVWADDTTERKGAR